MTAVEFIEPLSHDEGVKNGGEFSFAPKRTKVREQVKNFLGIAPNSTSILIKGLMCVAVEFSFVTKRTTVHERVKNFLRECTKFYINFN